MNPQSKLNDRPRKRTAFTLVELLITISIIALMASMILFAFYAAQDAAKEAKTKSLIAKLDAVIKARWDSYKTRRVPILIQDEFIDVNRNGVYDSGIDTQISDYNGNGTWEIYSPSVRAKMRLDGLHDLMRLELPDRWTDIADNPVTLASTASSTVFISRPAASSSYQRRYLAGTPSDNFQGAECLYLIIQSCLAEEGDAKDIYKPDDVADTDGDGYMEFVDGWKQPIRFLRWAPGFQNSELQVAVMATVTGSPGGTVTLTGNALPVAAGSFLGGAIIGSTGNGKPFDTTAMAKITGYSYAGGTATVSYTFVGASPSFSGQVALTNPDPFDPRGVYPTAIAPQPPFALYPMIFSAGSNKCFGVVTDSATPLRYASSNLNPFFVTTGGTPEFIGTARDIPAEPNFVTNGWLDNIHNHMIGTR